MVYDARTRTNGFEVIAKPHFPAPHAHTMMPSRSTPNLQQQQQQQQNRESKSHTPSIYSYLHNQSGLNFAPVSTTTTPPTRDADSPPPAPPVRDSSSLKSIKYGPGHEKFPSWPVPAAADTPQALRGPPSGGSHRSKSWTDHTNYPKEKVVTYTRPYMKRQHSSHTQQKLKTVMERCEKIPPETYESRFEKINDRLYLPHVDRDGKPLGDMEYNVPSPPERDISKPQLTQAELEELARSYQDASIEKYYEQDMKGLENFIEYARSYEETLFPHISQKHDETVLTNLHQKQLSYAQSEGYHSYVSSTDSTSTPFLDRLRRDSEAVPSRQPSSWDDMCEQETPSVRREGRDSVVTTSSGSASSSETLKWHGSMSDVSVASSSCTHLANSSSSSMSKQHIAHSARVQTPQRHHSESVLYMGGSDNPEVWKDRESRNNNTNKLKLFAVNTYTVQNDQQAQQQQQQQQQNNRLPTQTLSVADRISELEKQQKYSYLDPDKKHKVSDPTLKAIQKKALLSFYERHHNNPAKSSGTWRSEPQLAQSQPTLVPIPQPPPRIKSQTPSRRASSASDYASNTSKRSSLASNREAKDGGKATPRHQHSNSCGSLSSDLLGPVIVGPSISLDDWVPQKPPERPPKNPHLRIAYPDLFLDQRVPTPDLPPPSPPTVLEDEVYNNDEPLPPPPTESETSDWQQEFRERLKENTTGNQFAAPQVETQHKTVEETYLPRELSPGMPKQQILGIPERGNSRYSSVRCAQNESRRAAVETKNETLEGRQIPSDHRHIPSDASHIPSDNRHIPSDSRHMSSESLMVPGENKHTFSESRVFSAENRHSLVGSRQSAAESRHSVIDNRHNVDENKHILVQNRHRAIENRQDVTGNRYVQGENRHMCENANVSAAVGHISESQPVECESKHAVPSETRNSPDRRYVSTENRHTPPENRHMPSKNRHVPPESRHMPPESRNVPPENRHMPPENRHMPPENRHMPLENRHVSPENRHMPPENGSIPNENRHMSPENRHIPPEHRHMPPENRHVPPENRHMPLENRHVSPENRHVPPENGSIPPESRHLSPENRHTPPENRHMTADNRHMSPENRHIPPEHRHMSPENRHTSPETRQPPSEHRHLLDNRHVANEKALPCDSRASNEIKSPTKDQVLGFPNQRNYAERSSARYPAMQKLVLNGNVAVGQKVVNGVCDQYRAEPLRTQVVAGREDDKANARNVQRASIAEGTPRDVPPPLQPRQMRINQSMRARIPESRSGGVSTRTSPPRDDKLRDSRPLNYTMSQSKASYLASRRDRDRIVPDSDTGSYKRTVSPNGHLISTEVLPESPRINPRETVWPAKQSKEAAAVYKNYNNNTSILRRASMCDNQSKNPGTQPQDDKEEHRKTQMALPDVLPINAKIMAPRSHYNRPTHLSLSTHLDDSSPPKSPPKSPTASPPKSPLRSSPYTPLRSTNLSSSPLRTPSLRLSPQANSATSTPSPARMYPAQKIGSTIISPPSPQKTSSPEIRPVSMSLQRASMTEMKTTTQRTSIHEIRPVFSSPQRTSPPSSDRVTPPPSQRFAPLSPQRTEPQCPQRSDPFQSPQRNDKVQRTTPPEIRPTLSPNLANKTTPVKTMPSPASTPVHTPVRASPESSPPSSPKTSSVQTSPPASPKLPEQPKVIEGLQMIQRTEVILRVNTTTTDASSQTEKEELPPTPLPTRRKLQEEIDCEKLSQDFISQLPVTDRLKGLLVPGPEHKKVTDYVTGLFRIDVTSRPRPANSPFRSRNNTPSSSPPPVSTNSSTYITTKTSELTTVVPSLEPTSPLSATSTYFTTSEPKAKFLTRYSQDMNQYTIKNTKDLNQKKEELVNRLDRKLQVLRGEQLVVTEECRINNELGENVESHITRLARPHETAKFRLHVEEVGKITSLLLGLSGRLARVENALMGMPEDHAEKRILESKRDKLLEQLEEAKKLKESIDRRSVNVSNILYKYLNSEEYADYDHFINMKAKLIMDSKDIADKIKLGEEQLVALKETLIVTD